MKEITCKIGELAEFICQTYNIDFPTNTFIEVPFKLELPDENDKWQNCSKLYKKETDLYLYKGLEGSGNHLMMDENNILKLLKDFEGAEKVSENQIVFSPQIDSKTHLYKTPNGFIHHNTTEIEKKASKYLLPGWELVMESGTIGNSMTAIVPFMYKHSQNKVIILDDINTIFRTNYRDPVLNFMMAILDKKAATTKPVKIDKSQISRYNRQLEESVNIHIDREQLKENRLFIEVDGQVICNEHLKEDEARSLYEMIKPLKETSKNKLGMPLREIQFNRYEDDSEEDMEEYEEYYEEENEEFNPYSIPERFNFNSRVIMITNVDMSEINQAFRERCLIYHINLTVDQYIERLESILPDILKDDLEISETTLNWAKNYTYQALVTALKAFKFKYPIPYTLRGMKETVVVEINRDLTFRLFEELVQKWIIFSMKHLGSQISNSSEREEMSRKLIKPFIINYVAPMLKSPN